MSGRLSVCPTPIGNLEDVTLRVLRTLGEADVVLCEDTRRTRVLLDHHGVRAAGLLSLHEHNERARTAGLVERLRGGEHLALVTDAGMPGVSDPGWVLVRACVEAGVRIEVLPGASAVIVAVVASGLPVEQWRFVGFLPRRRGELERLLVAPEALVAFESPRRLAASLAVLADAQPARAVAVGRELTKVHEEVVRGSAQEVAALFGAREARGEVVVVVGPRVDDGAHDVEAALEALERLVEAGARARPAARVVGELLGVPANTLYEAHLGRRAGP